MDDIQRDIDWVERRVRRYWVEDGLSETLSGLMLALVGIYLALVGLVPGRGPGAVALAAGFPVLLFTVCLLARKWVVAAKDRYVHPRTGFVQLPRPKTHRWSSGMLAACMAALLALLVNRTPFILTWIPALLGLVLGAAFFAAGRRTALTRFPVEGILVAVAGFAVSLQHLEENLAAGLLFAWTGLVMSAGGAIVFLGYLRRSHPPEGA